MPFKLLVCMTTTPERLESSFFFRVLNSILSQRTSASFKIVLFVPARQLRTGTPYPDPEFLYQRYDRAQLAIHRCEDRGPATKFAGLLTYLPFVEPDVSHVVIADDDIILRDHVFQAMLERLEALKTQQDCRHLVLANDVGVCNNLPTVAGYAGILVPMEFFRTLAGDTTLAPLWISLSEGKHPCFNVDDMLLSKLLKRFDYSVAATGLDPFREVMDRGLTDEHPPWFELCKHTPRDDDTLQCFMTPF